MNTSYDNRSEKNILRLTDVLAAALLLNSAIYQLSPAVVDFLTYYLPLPLGGTYALEDTSSFYSIIYYCITFLLPAFFIIKLSPVTNGRVDFRFTIPKFYIPFAVMTLGGIAVSGDVTVWIQKRLSGLGVVFNSYTPDIPRHTSGLILLFISTAIVPAIVEELLFRKVILERLTPFGNAFALLVSASAFALMHANPGQILYTYTAGLFLGFITIKTGSVLPAMLLHFLNNSLSLVYLILREFAPERVFKLTVSTTDTAIKLIGLFVFVYMAKKFGESEKDIFSFKKLPSLRCFVRVLPLLYIAYVIYLSLKWVCIV